MKFASASAVEVWRFPAVMVLAVLGFELTIFALRRGLRDRAFDKAALIAQQRRGTLIATAVLVGIIGLAAFVCSQAWYGVFAVLFGYVGFLFSRYVPEALFGDAGKTA